MADPLSPPLSSARHSLYLHPLPFLSSPSQISLTLCVPSHLCSLSLSNLFFSTSPNLRLTSTRKVCNFRDVRFWSLKISKWGRIISPKSHQELTNIKCRTDFVFISTSKAAKFILTPSWQKDVHSFC